MLFARIEHRLLQYAVWSQVVTNTVLQTRQARVIGATLLAIVFPS